MPYDQSQTVGAAFAAFGLISTIVGLAVFIFSIIIGWRIFAKSGLSGAMSLLLFVPIANIIVLCMLAFGTWPIYEELNQLRQRAGMGGGQQYPQGPQYPQNPQNPQYPQYR